MVNTMITKAQYEALKAAPKDYLNRQNLADIAEYEAAQTNTLATQTNNALANTAATTQPSIISKAQYDELLELDDDDLTDKQLAQIAAYENQGADGSYLDNLNTAVQNVVQSNEEAYDEKQDPSKLELDEYYRVMGLGDRPVDTQDKGDSPEQKAWDKRKRELSQKWFDANPKRDTSTLFGENIDNAIADTTNFALDASPYVIGGMAAAEAAGLANFSGTNALGTGTSNTAAGLGKTGTGAMATGGGNATNSLATTATGNGYGGGATGGNTATTTVTPTPTPTSTVVPPVTPTPTANSLFKDMDGNDWVNLITSLGSTYAGTQAADEQAKAYAEATANSLAETKRQFDINQTNQAPFLQAGTKAINHLSNDISDYDTDIPIFEQGEDFKFDLESDPGYKFAVAEAEKAVNRGAASQGKFNSGNRLAELADRIAGTASLYANDAYNRQMGTYKTNYGNDVQDYQFRVGENRDLYGRDQDEKNRWASMAGVGQTAANSLGNYGQNYANTMGNLNLTGAQGKAKSANDWWGSLNNGLQGYMNNSLFNTYLNK